MPAGWAAAAAAATGIASSGVQASAGKKGAEAASEAQLAGLGDANRTIRDAMAQYGPRVAGGNRAYGQLQQFYGQGGQNPNRALSAQEKKRLGTLQKRIDAGGALSANEQQELNSIQGMRNRRKAYGGDSDLANTVGREQEQGLLDLESSFGKEEEQIFAQQEQAQQDYTARNAGLDAKFGQASSDMDERFKGQVGFLDTRYGQDVNALDAGFRGETGALDTQYYGEERALRDKIEKGDITQDPGYKFRLEQGQLARERGAAARGGLLSGGHLKDLEEYSQGQASQEFGAATGRLYDLYGLGKENYTQRRGNVAGDYERGRGYKTQDYTLGRGFASGDYERGRGNLTGDYERTRGFGRQDYGDLRSFYGQNLEQRRGRFDRQYGQGTDQRNFAVDRFDRRVGGARDLSNQGSDAMNQRSNLAGSLASLYSQAGTARGQGARAGYDALGQGVGGALNDASFLALLYGQGGFDGGGRRGTRQPGIDPNYPRYTRGGYNPYAPLTNAAR